MRAERKAGEMLGQLEKGNEGRPKLNQAGIVSEYREVLDDNKIPSTTAHRWQQLAEMPEFAIYLLHRRGFSCCILS